MPFSQRPFSNSKLPSFPWAGNKTTKPRARHPLELMLPDLLFPHPAPVSASADAAWIADLGLYDLADALTTDRRYGPFVRKLLGMLTTDTGIIVWRQAILQDLAKNPALCVQIERILPHLADLRQGHALLGKRKRGILLETVDRLSELDLYLEAIQSLHTALSGAALTSEGLCGLRDGLQTALDSESFQSLQADLPTLQAPLSKLASLTVGINLDADLQPVSVLLLGINDKPFSENAAFLDRLLGLRPTPEGETGIAPMHNIPADPEQRPLSALFQDLERLAHQIALPIARELERYVRASSGPLGKLEDQLAFYVAAARLEQKLRARGVPICYPQIAAIEERVMHAEGLMNIALTLRTGRTDAVASDAAFGEGGRIALLTGPNSGGKTTYLQAVGLAQTMAQTGLFITATGARISPVDALLTHFPALETRQQGRLSEEAARLRQIFVGMSAHSLVLLNESLASTTPAEGIGLAQEVIGALRAIGARAIFATHLIELAEHLAAIEARVPGDSKLVSLIATVAPTDDGRSLPTFHIVPGVPMKTGYAGEIARKYGISLTQLLDAHRKP